MKYKLLMIFFFSATLFAQTSLQYCAEELSISGEMIVQYKYNYEIEHHEIWLKSAADTTNKAMLFEFNRDASVIFSPDESLLLVNDRYGSDVADIKLFKKTGPLQYKEIKNRNMLEKSWQFFFRKNKVQKPTFDHQYTEGILWSSDSRFVLLRLQGHESALNFTDGWLCIYDIQKDSFSTDLSLINNGAVHLK